MSRLRNLGRRRPQSGGGERGMVEVGVAAAGALLVVGAVVGNGAAAAVVDMSDSQTWLPGADGSVVQINPATGQPEYRLVVGADGERMEVTQGDGFLVVTNLETGVMTPIDLAGLVASGARQSDRETEVLIGGGLMVLAEREPGFVQVVDPVTLGGVGSPYRAGEDLADVVMDRDGTVWMVTETGDLRALGWDEDASALSVEVDREVRGAGPMTRLVPHQSGTSVFAPDGGAVLQVGAGTDYVQQVPALTGEVLAADFAPADLVPASAVDAGSVVMISGRELLDVDVAGLGCTRPLTPAVLAERVYVPCGGTGRVLVLDARGQRAGQDVVVPGGGDPTLIVDDGRLVVHDPDDGRIVVVQKDGRTAVTDLEGAEVPTGQTQVPPAQPPVSAGGGSTEPPASTPPVALPPTSLDPQPPHGGGDESDRPDRPDHPDRPDRPGPGDDPDSTDPTDPDDEPDPTDPGTTDPDATEPDPDLTPTGVRAVAQGDGSVTVSWTAPPTTPREYVVESSDGLTQVTVPADRTSTDLADVVCGSDLTVTVLAHHGDGEVAGAQTDVTTPACVDPPQPEDLRPGNVSAELSGTSLVLTWDASSVEPAHYLVEGIGAVREVPATAARSVVFADPPCGDVRLTVTAVHPDAGQESASVATSGGPCPADPADLRPRDLTLTKVGTGDGYRLTWQAPVLAPESYRASGSGVDRAVPAGATSVDLTIACAASVRVTLVAQHAGGETGSATSNAVTNTCAAPVTLTAPTGVTARYLSGDKVRVSWGASSPAADEYVVVPSSGGSVSAGTATSLDVSVARGASYTFRVQAQWEDQTATSAPSAAVTVPAAATAPGTPGGASASYTGRNGTSSVTVAVSWNAPADGGSPITGYQLSWPGGSTTVGGRSASVTVACSGQALCTTGGTATVQIRAVNAVGVGAAAAASASVPAAPPPPPEDGASVVRIRVGQPPLYDTGIPVTVHYEPTTAWAAYEGTCTLYVSGVRDGSSSRVVDCDGASSGFATGGGGIVSAYVVASGAGSGARSATGTKDVPPRNAWGYCNPNTRICTDPVSLDAGDPDVVPAPWTPPVAPDVPNPPVLVAGLGMLVGAGTSRTLRSLVRTTAVAAFSSRKDPA